MQLVIQANESDGPLSFIQNDFSGGMNLFDDDTKIGDTEYREAFYVKNRKKTLIPATQPDLLTAPSGLKQGIYGFDTFFVLFVAGKAYYQTLGTTTWIRLSGFQMSTTEPFIYVAAVPASNINYGRALATAGNFQGTALNTGIFLNQTVTINGLPAGLVCQDGVNQPWIIFADKSSRILQTYDEWTLDEREYVPIGKQMIFFDGILFVAAPDGKQLFRSVEGRPIDFVVNIDIAGNKGGDASTVSYAVSYNPITCLSGMNSGQLFIGTTFGCYPVNIDYTNLIFGEPTFTNTGPILAGCVNQSSFADILGDYAIVDYSSILSFNAVQTLKNEGRNSIFSLKIYDFISGIVQDSNQVCCQIFNNYLYVSLKTTYGYGLLVFDTLVQTWVSFDITPEPIIMLAATGNQNSPRLFGISTANVYELYPVTGAYEISTVVTGAAVSSDCRKELRTKGFRAVLKDSSFDSEATITEISDGKKGKQVTQDLQDTTGGLDYEVDYPAYWNSESQVDNLYFNMENSKNTGWKLAGIISWENDAVLTQVQIDAELATAKVSSKQQTKAYAS